MDLFLVYPNFTSTIRPEILPVEGSVNLDYIVRCCFSLHPLLCACIDRGALRNISQISDIFFDFVLKKW